MTALGVPARAVPGLRRLETRALGAAVLVLAVLSVAVLVLPGRFDLPGLDARFAAAAAVYAGGHVLRAMRLAVLTYHPGLRLRRVLEVHVFTAGVSVLLPFKLGEVARVREVGVLQGSFRAGLVTVWLERTFDAIVLAALVVVCAVAVPGSLDLLGPLLALVIAFIAVTVVLLTVAPPNLRLLMLHLLRRGHGERGLTALTLLRQVLDILRPAPQRLTGRVPTLVLLSLLIWAAEVAAVSIALPGIAGDLSELSTGLLSALASISSGVTALSPGFDDRLATALADFGVSAPSAAYRQVLVVPTVVAGAVAGWLHLRRRGGARA